MMTLIYFKAEKRNFPVSPVCLELFLNSHVGFAPSAGKILVVFPSGVFITLLEIRIHTNLLSYLDMIYFQRCFKNGRNAH